MKLHSTYHAVCLCGRAVESETRETTCAACGRLLVFEWGKAPPTGIEWAEARGRGEAINRGVNAAAPPKAKDDKSKAKGAAA